jgi:uncharacterized membrane protein YdjX (TVP38/TMEM64 family)
MPDFFKSNFQRLKKVHEVSPKIFWLMLSVAILPTFLSSNLVIFFGNEILKLKELSTDGLLIYTFLTIPMMIFALVPSTFVAGGAGFLFGFSYGISSTFIGYNLASSLAFFFLRRLDKGKVQSFLSNYPKAVSFQKKIKNDEKWIVTLARISPFGTFSLVNLTFAVSQISFKKYFLGTLMGMFPRTLVAVFIGTSAKSIYDFTKHGVFDFENPFYVFLFGFSVLGFLLLFWLVNKNLD